MEQNVWLHWAPKSSRMKDDGKSSQCRSELLQGDVGWGEIQAPALHGRAMTLHLCKVGKHLSLCQVAKP